METPQTDTDRRYGTAHDPAIISAGELMVCGRITSEMYREIVRTIAPDLYQSIAILAQSSDFLK